MAQDINEKLVFAVSPSGTGDGVPVLVVAVPKGAWEYMKDGKTHHIDLTAIGMPVKLVMFGAEDHDDAMETLQEAAAAQGASYLDLRRQDFGIKPQGDGGGKG